MWILRIIRYTRTIMWEINWGIVQMNCTKKRDHQIRERKIRYDDNPQNSTGCYIIEKYCIRILHFEWYSKWKFVAKENIQIGDFNQSSSQNSLRITHWWCTFGAYDLHKRVGLQVIVKILLLNIYKYIFMPHSIVL